MRGSEGRVHQQGPGAAPRWGSGGNDPEADDIFSNTLSTEVLDNICSKKKTLFNITKGHPLPMPAGANAVF